MKIKQNIAYWCKTKESAEWFMNKCREQGFLWVNGINCYKKTSEWERFKKNTCYEILTWYDHTKTSPGVNLDDKNKLGINDKIIDVDELMKKERNNIYKEYDIYINVRKILCDNLECLSDYEILKNIEQKLYIIENEIEKETKNLQNNIIKTSLKIQLEELKKIIDKL